MKSVSSATSDTRLCFRVSRMIRLPIVPMTLDVSFASETRTVVFIGRKQKKKIRGTGTKRQCHRKKRVELGVALSDERTKGKEFTVPDQRQTLINYEWGLRVILVSSSIVWTTKTTAALPKSKNCPRGNCAQEDSCSFTFCPSPHSPPPTWPWNSMLKRTRCWSWMQIMKNANQGYHIWM